MNHDTVRILLLICSSLLCCSLQAQPLMTWLRPNSVNVDVVGIQIVAGPELEFMRWLAKYLPGYQHRFESYPLKRNWHLIKNSQKNADSAYCFFGAVYTSERETWGYFTKPTTVLLPYPMVARAGELDEFVRAGHVSVQTLLENGKSTVFFDGTRNMWSDLIDKYMDDDGLVIHVDPGGRSAASITAELLKKGRIDFGYIGSGYKEVSELERQLAFELTVYRVAELNDRVGGGNRLLCSKSTLGLAIQQDINETLARITANPALNKTFRDLNFEMIGYHPSLKDNFEQAWRRYFNNGEMH